MADNGTGKKLNREQELLCKLVYILDSVTLKLNRVAKRLEQLEESLDEKIGRKAEEVQDNLDLAEGEILVRIEDLENQVAHLQVAVNCERNRGYDNYR